MHFCHLSHRASSVFFVPLNRQHAGRGQIKYFFVMCKYETCDFSDLLIISFFYFTDRPVIVMLLGIDAN